MTSAYDPVVVLLSARAQPGREEELCQAFLNLVTASRHDPGCITYELHVVEEDRSRIFLYEWWTSRAALDAHLRTPPLEHFRSLCVDLMQGRFEDAISFLLPLRPASVS